MKMTLLVGVYLALSTAAHSQTNSMTCQGTNLPVEARALLSREQPKGDGLSITGLVVCVETNTAFKESTHALVTNIPFRWIAADTSDKTPLEDKGRTLPEGYTLSISIGNKQYDAMWACFKWGVKKGKWVVFDNRSDPYLRIELRGSNTVEVSGASVGTEVTLTKIKPH